MANLVLNPGFETGEVNGSWDFDDWTEVFAGPDSVSRVTGRSGWGARLNYIGSQPSIYQDMTVVAEKAYSFEFWTKGDGAKAGLYGVYDVSNSAWVVNKQSTGVPGTTFTEVTPNFQTPVGCVTVRIYFYSPTPDTYDYAVFDDVLLEKVFLPLLLPLRRRMEDY